jgi:hypothetical protein
MSFFGGKKNYKDGESVPADARRPHGSFSSEDEVSRKFRQMMVRLKLL